MIWERSADAFYATVEALENRDPLHLIVERKPDGDWDWAIWTPDGTYQADGIAPTMHAAMSEAELS